tara:strand:+ start:553 stop:1341 length:789 start_codon:yes stop_codon:yes gene_type:complete
MPKLSKKWSKQRCQYRHNYNKSLYGSMKNMFRERKTHRSNFLPREILDTVRSKLDELYQDVHVEDRPTFLSRGKVAMNRRDALWYAIPTPDGYLPHYRASTASYGSPTIKIKKADNTKIMDHKMLEWMQPIIDRMENISKHQIQHFVFHRYVGTEDKIGAHHDKTQDLGEGSTIFSLSIGEPRRFDILADTKDGWIKKNERETFIVKDNDLICMPWDVNQVYRHTIVPSKKYGGVRYSITARSKCTLYNKESKEQKIIDTKL